jgi:alpha-galactosidase
MVSRIHSNDTHASAAGPGHWNDPDMLEVGNGGMSATEYRTHFSMWAIMAAPLLIGSDIRSASATTLGILTNTDVIAIDQDSLGKQGTILTHTGSTYVYRKALANGDVAVALLNEGSATATISTSASAIGLSGASSYTLKDLWSKASRTTTGTISASVPAHGTVMYRVSKGGGTQPPGRVEAESGTIFHGTVDSNHAGFSGSGFVNYVNEVGSYVELKLTPAAAGSAKLTFRYANGLAADRPVSLTVNGGSPVVLHFPGTGSWTTWGTASITVTLNAGANTIRATATTADGGPNLDWVEAS